MSRYPFPTAELHPRHVNQGDFVVSDSEEDVLVTVLGSCIGVCLWDSHHRIGGMHHLVLPPAQSDDDLLSSYGVNAMEVLINAVLQRGADRKNLRAKLFGGAQMTPRLSDAGERNAAFAMRFLESEDILCVASDLGGLRARSLQFWPTSGRARLKLLPRTARDPAAGQPPPDAPSGDVELF